MSIRHLSITQEPAVVDSGSSSDERTCAELTSELHSFKLPFSYQFRARSGI